MKKYFLYFSFLTFCIDVVAQQEEIISLPVHPKVNTSTNSVFLQKKALHRNAALALPLFDDFYQKDIFPDPQLWQDNFVYINTTFPQKAVTVGVATFDGTNATGKPYSLLNNAYGPADKLTSNPINLGGLTNDSSVFLSFYYLSGEYGESPTAPTDSLSVQFLDTLGNWNIMWEITADTSREMSQVFIKVDSNYLYPNFQFRFQSVGNLNGANDTWHVDYVKLDKLRDTSVEVNIKEMAYEFLPPSLLKTYYVMPYHQFDTTDLADTVNLVVRNNFINPTTDIVDFYTATLVNDNSILSDYNGSSKDFSPLTDNTLQYPKFSIPLGLSYDTVVVKVDYHFNVSAESGLSEKVLANDSVTHEQVFSNFLSYDDGSPERGYWVRGLESYKMAVKYGLRYPDTLRAMKFQPFSVKGDNGLATFSICVWKNFNRNTVYNEADLVYKQSNLKLSDLVSEFGVDTLNGYYYAPLKPDFVLNGASFPLVLSDTFAIGLIVDNKESLVVGFDRNNNRSAYNFYVDGVTKWRESDIAGTMIMNPVLGQVLPGYLTPVKTVKSQNYELKVYPNPTNDELFVEGLLHATKLEVFNMKGQLIHTFILPSSGYIDVKDFPSGQYLIKVSDLETHQSGSSRFIKG